MRKRVFKFVADQIMLDRKQAYLSSDLFITLNLDEIIKITKWIYT